jgi:hypothetical protein
MTHAKTLAASFLTGLALITVAAMPITAAGTGGDTCQLTVSPTSGGSRIVAVYQGAAVNSGQWHLRLTAPGADIDQSGDFTAQRGEILTLSEIELGSGPARVNAPVNARLTVTVGRRKLICPVISGPIHL